MTDHNSKNDVKELTSTSNIDIESPWSDSDQSTCHENVKKSPKVTQKHRVTKSTITITKRNVKEAFEALIKYIQYKNTKKEQISLNNLKDWKKNNSKNNKKTAETIELTSNI